MSGTTMYPMVWCKVHSQQDLHASTGLSRGTTLCLGIPKRMLDIATLAPEQRVKIIVSLSPSGRLCTGARSAFQQLELASDWPQCDHAGCQVNCCLVHYTLSEQICVEIKMSLTWLCLDYWLGCLSCFVVFCPIWT